MKRTEEITIVALLYNGDRRTMTWSEYMKHYNTVKMIYL